VNTAAEKLELIGVCGIILALYSNSADARGTIIEITGILFSAAKGNDVKKRHGALDCLMEAAAMPEVRPRLLEFGCKEVVQPFVEPTPILCQF